MSNAASFTSAQHEAARGVRRGYVVREVTLSAVINALLSIWFVELAFHGQGLIPFEGRHGSLLDLVPQTLMVALMSLLVPNVVGEKRLSRGELAWCLPRGGHAPSSIFMTALATGLVCSAAAWMLGWGIVRSLHPSPMRFGVFLLTKAVYGGLLGAAITYVTLTRRFPAVENAG